MSNLLEELKTEVTTWQKVSKERLEKLIKIEMEILDTINSLHDEEVIELEHNDLIIKNVGYANSCDTIYKERQIGILKEYGVYFLPTINEFEKRITNGGDGYNYSHKHIMTNKDFIEYGEKLNCFVEYLVEKFKTKEVK